MLHLRYKFVIAWSMKAMDQHKSFGKRNCNQINRKLVYCQKG